eukprot:m.66563 g.66563  ORF g.66563 m.66563 type:complete len:73 (-) comp11816_c0_seq3:445-663(-)
MAFLRYVHEFKICQIRKCSNLLTGVVSFVPLVEFIPSLFLACDLGADLGVDLGLDLGVDSVEAFFLFVAAFD